MDDTVTSLPFDVTSRLVPAFDIGAGPKSAHDPNGIVDPGRLGLPTPFGDPAWP